MRTIKDVEQTGHMYHTARSDFQFASFGVAHLDGETKSCENQICYVFQQSAEKMLKAYLWSRGNKPAKTHNMAGLLSACLDLDPGLESIQNACMVLQGFVAFARYPESEEHFYDRDDVREAQEAASHILQVLSPRIEEALASGPRPGS